MRHSSSRQQIELREMCRAFGLSRYLERIGVVGPCAPDLDTLTRVMDGHSRAIAFENIDVVLHKVISIVPADVEKKLVQSNRGGYCFEQNTLLLSALLAIGFAAMPMLCRVRYLKAPGEQSAYTHMALRVVLPDGARFLADVGFAGTNSIAPVSLDTDELQELPEGRFRAFAAADGHTTLQRQLPGDELRDLYLFRTDDVATAPDLEQSNWFSCTYPRSRFTTSFFVSRVVGEQRHHILADGTSSTYVVRAKDGMAQTTQVADCAHLTRLLNDVFGLNLPADTVGLDRYLPAAMSSGSGIDDGGHFNGTRRTETETEK